MSVIIRLQNLPWSANSLDIRTFFAGLSIPEGGVHIVGGEMGDAFIAFSTDEDARKAMMLTGHKLKEVQISLMLSSRSEMQKVIEAARSMTLSAVAAPKPVASVVSPEPALTTTTNNIQIPGFGNDEAATYKRDSFLNVEKTNQNSYLPLDQSKEEFRSRGRDRDNDRQRKRDFKEAWEKGESAPPVAAPPVLNHSASTNGNNRSSKRSHTRSRSRSRERDRSSRRSSYDRERTRSRERSKNSRDRDRNRDRQDSKKIKKSSKDRREDKALKPSRQGDPDLIPSNRTGHPTPLLPTPMLNPQPAKEAPQIWLPQAPVVNPLQQLASLQNATQLLAALPVNLVDQIAAHLTGRPQPLSQSMMPSIHSNEDDRRRRSDDRDHRPQRNNQPEKGFHMFQKEGEIYCAEVVGAPEVVSYGEIRRAFGQSGIVLRDIKMHHGRIIVSFLNAETKMRCMKMSEQIFIGDHPLTVYHLSSAEFEQLEDTGRTVMPQVDGAEPRKKRAKEEWREERSKKGHLPHSRFGENAKSRGRFEEGLPNSRFGSKNRPMEDDLPNGINVLLDNDEESNRVEDFEKPIEKGKDHGEIDKSIEEDELLTHTRTETKGATNEKLPQKELELKTVLLPDPVQAVSSITEPELKSTELDDDKLEEPIPDCVLLKCLPKDSTDRDICDFFSDIGICPLKIHQLLDQSGKPSGDAFVEFSTKDQVLGALTKNGAPFGMNNVSVLGATKEDLKNAFEGKPVTLTVRRNQSDVSAKQVSSRVPPSRNQQYPPSQRYSNSKPNSSSYGYIDPKNPPPDCVLNLYNIPFRAGTDDIIEFFRPEFHVPPHMVFRRLNEKGHNTGDARVILPSYRDVQRAAATLHKKYILDRPIYLEVFAHSNDFNDGY